MRRFIGLLTLILSLVAFSADTAQAQGCGTTCGGAGRCEGGGGSTWCTEVYSGGWSCVNFSLYCFAGVEIGKCEMDAINELLLAGRIDEAQALLDEQQRSFEELVEINDRPASFDPLDWTVLTSQKKGFRSRGSDR